MEIDGIIGRIYDAGADANQWTPLLAELTTCFRGVGAALHVGAESSFSFGAAYNFDPEALKAYEDYYFSINPLNYPLTLTSTGSVVGDHELVPREAYHHSEFYNDFGLRFGLNGSVTGVLGKNGAQVSCLGVVTGTGSDPYSPDELDLFRRLMPHVRRALDLNKRLAALHATGEAAHVALDMVSFGVILVGDKGRILRANKVAEQMIKAGDGLKIFRDCLHITDSAAESRFLSLLSASVHRHGICGGAFTIPRLEGRRPIFGRIVPFRGTLFRDTPLVRAFVYLRDPEACPVGDVQEFASSIGLTQAEARVLERLLECGEAKDVATSLGIATATARNHIARIMSKAGTHKQTDLLQLVLASRLPILY